MAGLDPAISWPFAEKQKRGRAIASVFLF